MLGTQFEFLQRKLDAHAKSKVQSLISSYHFFLSKLDEIRQDENSYASQIRVSNNPGHWKYVQNVLSQFNIFPRILRR